MSPWTTKSHCPHPATYIQPSYLSFEPKAFSKEVFDSVVCLHLLTFPHYRDSTFLLTPPLHAALSIQSLKRPRSLDPQLKGHFNSIVFLTLHVHRICFVPIRPKLPRQYISYSSISFASSSRRQGSYIVTRVNQVATPGETIRCMSVMEKTRAWQVTWRLSFPSEIAPFWRILIEQSHDNYLPRHPASPNHSFFPLSSDILFVCARSLVRGTLEYF